MALDEHELAALFFSLPVLEHLFDDEDGHEDFLKRALMVAWKDSRRAMPTA